MKPPRKRRRLVPLRIQWDSSSRWWRLGAWTTIFSPTISFWTCSGARTQWCPVPWAEWTHFFSAPCLAWKWDCSEMRLRFCIYALPLSLSLIATIIDDAIIFIVAIFRAIFIRTFNLFMCLLCDCLTCIIPLILWFKKLNKSIRN